jgi:UDP-GlcNAc3NAcA epimerase
MERSEDAVKIISIVGARPQFIKSAMVSRSLRLSGQLTEIMIHTGQHYDSNMSDIFFKELGLAEPDYRLQAQADTQGRQTAIMLEGIESILIKEKPDAALVYGDTNSTLAGALAAAKLHVPIAHVEAGLRSYNRRMPEEVNRVLTDHLSAVNYCPTETAARNLEREGLFNYEQVGDVMNDLVLALMPTAMKQSNLADKLGLVEGEYYLATVHRAENTDDPDKLKAILQALGQANQQVVLPIHPRTRQRAEQFKLDTWLSAPSIRIIEPVSYLDMIALTCGARAVLTDSGGLQKEAFILRTPCITMREETEWTETVDSGWNRLAGTDSLAIAKAMSEVRIPSGDFFPYGNGDTSELIAASLIRFLEKTNI